MHNEFTAIIERDGDWFIAYSPEISGANGQGRTKENVSGRKDLPWALRS
jgi:predicted RNase H-like HicB family nuclease